MQYSIKNIRNFAIIAHVDHGKSTLSDRLIDLTGAISTREMTECVLDNMELEKEKGITIKSQTIRLNYNYKGEDFVLNLVDTPGHVDFQYEVEKALGTIDIAVLLIDATKGVESQTLSNYMLAKKNPNLHIVVAINKIDSQNADIDMCKKQIETLLKLDINKIKIFYISGKKGTGVKELMEEGIIESNVYPQGDCNNNLKALIFDSWYDNYLGVVALIAIKEGQLNKKDLIITKSNNVKIEANKFGFMQGKMNETQCLKAGEIGYLITNVKETKLICIGDTLVDGRYNNETEPLPGFKKVIPVVFCSLYLEDPDEFKEAYKSLEKLNLNDSSFSFEPERSLILGMGFRCGFLGLLHMEIILERLLREYKLEFIVTTPNVIYMVKNHGEEVFKKISNAMDLPPQDKLSTIQEPIVLVTILTIDKYIGDVKALCFTKRGEFEEEVYMEETILMKFKMPLAEIILNFQDMLKSLTSGYASYTYEFLEYRTDSLCKLEFAINDEVLPALSSITHKDKALEQARTICLKLKENLPRAQVEIKIQGILNNKVIAGERLSAYRKDVIAKCYGGDRSRKDKLLDKQKKGKKNMNKRIHVPADVLIKILRI